MSWLGWVGPMSYGSFLGTVGGWILFDDNYVALLMGIGGWEFVNWLMNSPYANEHLVDQPAKARKDNRGAAADPRAD
jgi:hypothetical protein